uniref:NADH dehydrogenase subunit 1 n=1 Tax=Macrostomum lignano TaxID=282301 RepID=A0A1I8J0W8_9PLAT
MNCTSCDIYYELFSCSWYFSFNDFFLFLLIIYSLLLCIY